MNYINKPHNIYDNGPNRKSFLFRIVARTLDAKGKTTRAHQYSTTRKIPVISIKSKMSLAFGSKMNTMI